MWVPPEIKDPVLLHAPTRKSVACFGAVSLSSGKLVRSMCKTFNAVTFETFLKTLLRHRSRDMRMVLVLDNVRCHHAVRLKPLHRFPRLYRRGSQLITSEARPALQDPALTPAFTDGELPLD